MRRPAGCSPSRALPPLATARLVPTSPTWSTTPCRCHPPQVLNKEFEVVTHLARTAGGFGRRDAALALGGLVDKIAELKHK